MASIRTDLHDEIQETIFKHLEELGEYIPTLKEVSPLATEHVLACAERLAEICHQSPESASPDLYGEAYSCRHTLESFLKSMNQQLDNRFAETTIGQIWARSQTWCQRAAIQSQLSMHDVWDFIAPVAPDFLNYVGNGQYEARWWKPAPTMDIEILKYTEGVVIDGEPFEPQNLTGGLALRFSISRFS